MKAHWTFTVLTVAVLSVVVPINAAGNPERLRGLFRELGSSDLTVKNRASQGLLAYAETWVRQDIATMRKSLPVILAALDDDDSLVRIQASAFFGMVGMFRRSDGMRILKDFVGDVLEHFEDPNSQVRANMVRCIAGLEPAPPPEAVEPFLKHLDDPSGEVRRMAVLGLLRAAPQSQRAVEAVAALLDKKEDSERRREILQTLAFVKPMHPVLLAKVAEQLDEPNELLRFTTLRVLTEIGPPAAIAIHKIREIANDPATGKDLRISAEAALRAIEQRPPPKPRR